MKKNVYILSSCKKHQVTERAFCFVKHCTIVEICLMQFPISLFMADAQREILRVFSSTWDYLEKSKFSTLKPLIPVMYGTTFPSQMHKCTPNKINGIFKLSAIFSTCTLSAILSSTIPWQSRLAHKQKLNECSVVLL